MAVRPALPTELAALSRALNAMALREDGVIASALPQPLVAGTWSGWPKMLPGFFGMPSPMRVYVDRVHDAHRGVALVYAGRRPESVVIALAAAPEPEGGDAAFRLLSLICASSARRGLQRVFGAVPDTVRAREIFFQAGFYSYTRETWLVAPARGVPEPTRPVDARIARGRDAHDLFRFYASSTPHAVQRAEQLQLEDFDAGRRAGAFDPPHIGGNPLGMRRQVLTVVDDGARTRAYAVAYRGSDRHPHVVKIRTAQGDVDLARELARALASELPRDRPIVVPVRSYEDHVARGLMGDGFTEAATSTLFVKELAVRVEEPAFAPVIAR